MERGVTQIDENRLNFSKILASDGKASLGRRAQTSPLLGRIMSRCDGLDRCLCSYLFGVDWGMRWTEAYMQPLLPLPPHSFSSPVLLFFSPSSIPTFSPSPVAYFSPRRGPAHSDEKGSELSLLCSSASTAARGGPHLLVSGGIRPFSLILNLSGDTPEFVSQTK